MSSASPTPPPEAPVVYEMFFVLAANVTYSYESDETNRSYESVLVCAQDADEACALAKTVTEEGNTPVEAYNRAHLLDLIRQLGEEPLSPGHALSVSTGESSSPQSRLESAEAHREEITRSESDNFRESEGTEFEEPDDVF